MQEQNQEVGVVGRLNAVAESIHDWITFGLLKLSVVPNISLDDIRTVRNIGDGEFAQSDEAERLKYERLGAETGRFLFRLQEDASQHTDDKVKLLLSLATAIATATVAGSASRGWHWSWGVALLILGVAIYLCFAYFGVRVYRSPDPPLLEDAAASQKWAVQLHDAAFGNMQVHDLRVEIYRGAQRWLLAALIVAAVVSSWRLSIPVMPSGGPSAVSTHAQVRLGDLEARARDIGVVSGADSAAQFRSRGSSILLWDITPGMAIGWMVTLVSIIVGARVAVRGWRRSAEHRKEIDDKADLEIAKEVLLDALWNIPTLTDLVADQLTRGKMVPESMLRILDISREGYDQHWEKVYLLEDRTLRRDVINWFRELRMSRILLERYGEGVIVAGPIDQERLQNAAVSWSGQGLKGRALFDRLGFRPPG